jgi:hypothetical protein
LLLRGLSGHFTRLDPLFLTSAFQTKLGQRVVRLSSSTSGMRFMFVHWYALPWK